MSQIIKSSTAEYFAKNLQQVGFSSPTKAVLTTLKEAVDNALDACEQANLLPEIRIKIEKLGPGSGKNTDKIKIVVQDNGPGIAPEDLSKVFGEYLTSSKFGRGQCTRGQQGIGISAATTWAQLTQARGVVVITKTEKMRKAIRAQIDVDIKANLGVLRNKESFDWDYNHGTCVEFIIDGRIQLNGDGGLLTYLEGTVLVNPHLTLHYQVPGQDQVTLERVTQQVPQIPEATLPHPHTFKLGEFITYAALFGKVTVAKFLKIGFSRVTDSVIENLIKAGLSRSLLERSLSTLTEEEFKVIFKLLQEIALPSPSTKSVLTVGEAAISQSIQRLGEIDFFSVVTRKPTICDYKPVVVEVALARLKNKPDHDEPVQVLRFANRVPLQFDKAACAITQAIQTVNWRTYGLQQPKDSLPLGPYIFAVAITSPFIKFKNASKETIDSSDELVEEIRRALIQAGQKLSRYIKKEQKQADYERKLAHIEQFAPILINALARLVKASEVRKQKAYEGLKKLLRRDQDEAGRQLELAYEEFQKVTSSVNCLTKDSEIKEVDHGIIENKRFKN